MHSGLCVTAILEQLGLDSSFYTLFALFAVLFVALKPIFFKPFMRLFEIRHQRTVEDSAAADKLMEQAQAKFDEYQKLINEQRASTKREIESALLDARKQESEILAKAREDAKKSTQEAMDAIQSQKDQVRKQLEMEVETLARGISEQLLSRKA